MKFQRLQSAEIRPDNDVSQLVQWKLVDCVILNADGSERFRQNDVEVPEQWSQQAANILAQKYFRKAGVPDETIPKGTLEYYQKQNIPIWLAPNCYSDSAKIGSETSAKQVFHRMSGCWTYHGWKHKYFSSEEDARIFYDECYLALAFQLAAPNSPQWFNTGLHWAYGIEGEASGQWAISYPEQQSKMFPSLGMIDCYEIDETTAAVYQTPNSYEYPQPHACFIQPIDDDLVNEGGIMDLWVREARLFKHGSGTGTNFSTLRGKNERLSGGGVASGLISWLQIGDRAAGAIQSGGTTRRAAKMVICNLDHPEIEEFVDWKVREESKAASMFVGSQVLRNYFMELGDARNDPYTITPVAIIDRMDNGFEPEIYGVGWEEEARESVSGQNSNNSVRVTNDFLRKVDVKEPWDLTARTNGEVVKTLKSEELWDKICRAAWACGDPGVQFHDTINEWHTCPNDGQINGSNPCAEYLFLDNTACNLASLNFARFLKEDGSIDLQLYEHIVRLFTVILDISVQMASFPSKEIAVGTYNYRTLGLGPANVGGLLMRSGISYDSDEGRALAAGMMALMTGIAYQTSAEMAAELEAFPRWEINKTSFKEVMKKHQSACSHIKCGEMAGAVVAEAIKHWKFVVKEAPSFRNAQTTVCAPTGTISFVMDCDTTGVEPEFALVKYKNLAGGGTMKIVNPAVPDALQRLGMTHIEIERALEHINKTGSIENTPVSSIADYYSIFDCSNPAQPGGRCLSPMAHVLMVAALQPFVSGGISKTINLPNDATVADVDNIYRESHRLGIKSVALFRDGCKLTQPLNVSKKKSETKDIWGTSVKVTGGSVEEFAKRAAEFPAEAIVNAAIYTNDSSLPPRGVAEKLPWRRKAGYTQKAVIGDQTLFWRVSEYPDGRPGEIFIELSHEGSTLRAAMNCIAIAISVGLQRGTSIEKYVDQFMNTKFEPSGYVEGHEHIKFASSIMDLIAKDLAITYLGREDLIQNVTVPRLVQARSVGSDVTPRRFTGDMCPSCSSLLVRTGTCRTCSNCEYNEGCG